MTRLTYGSLFSGYGGLDLAVEAVLGAEAAWHCELDPNASKVLDAHWPGVPNLGDISVVDWSQVQPVDVLCGGFPCQDISSAGKGAGIKEGTRSGLWYRFADAIRVLRPRLVFVENVSALVVRGLDIVAADLAALGFDAEWGVLRASDVGACHARARLFLLAWPAADTDVIGGLGGLAVGRNEVRPDQRNHLDRRGGATASHAVGVEPERRGGLGGLAGTSGAGEGVDGERQRLRDTAGDRRTTASDANGQAGRFVQSRGRPGPIQGAEVDGGPAEQPGRRSGGGRSEESLARWGGFGAAIGRWELVVGRAAPDPTDERGRLNPPLAEWMMGLDAGWVTDHLDRSAALKAIGNGVVPQQAAHALTALLARIPAAQLEHAS